MFEKKEKHSHDRNSVNNDEDRSSRLKKPLIALRDHILHFGDSFKKTIKAGDDLSDVPDFLHDALRAEKVI